MNELFTVRPPGEAFTRWAALFGPLTGSERVSVRDALGRVAAEAIAAPETLPAFARSTMDGYAVRASDTYGASDASPAYLHVTGEVEMGGVARRPVGPGEAIRVHTGAMLPPAAESVVMIEDTNLRGEELEVLRAAAPGENTVEPGEDVRTGQPVLEIGHALRAQDLGALHALGITSLEVRKRPRIGILSTGDEVVAPEKSPPLGCVRDVNSVTVASVVERAGGSARTFGIAGDDEASLLAAARGALAACDALVLSAGSSVSYRDVTARAIDALGRPGVVVHGIALKPGKPTVLGACDGKPVIGLPGNPVSALVVAWRLLAPLVRFLAGEAVPAGGATFENTFDARVDRSVPSRPGREDYVPCTLARDASGELVATPVFGKSTLIFTLVRSHGLLLIPLDRAGVAAGDRVRVVVP